MGVSPAYKHYNHSWSRWQDHRLHLCDGLLDLDGALGNLDVEELVVDEGELGLAEDGGGVGLLDALGQLQG
jgi:hypothetical protein